MKSKKIDMKLSLNKKTIVNLSQSVLEKINGGASVTLCTSDPGCAQVEDTYWKTCKDCTLETWEGTCFI